MQIITKIFGSFKNNSYFCTVDSRQPLIFKLSGLFLFFQAICFTLFRTLPPPPTPPTAKKEKNVCFFLK